jgi:hypothetical protein
MAVALSCLRSGSQTPAERPVTMLIPQLTFHVTIRSPNVSQCHLLQPSVTKMLCAAKNR